MENFDLKKYLFENRVGMYSKANEVNTGIQTEWNSVEEFERDGHRVDWERFDPVILDSFESGDYDEDTGKWYEYVTDYGYCIVRDQHNEEFTVDFKVSNSGDEGYDYYDHITKIVLGNEENRQQDNTDQSINVSEMHFQDLQPNDKTYKIKRNEQGYIIQATNEDGETFKEGDRAITHEGPEIEIKGFIGQQGKVKAIYYTMPGLVAHTYDINGLSAIQTE